MKRLHSFAGWCSLGLAVSAIGVGVVATKRYGEQRVLATVLGEGTEAERLNVHWLRSAGCIEGFQTTLPQARDRNHNPLALYADQLWFVFDQSELLRKRLVLPRVFAEGVLITADVDAMVEPDVLDVDFELGSFEVDMGESASPSDLVRGNSNQATMASGEDRPMAWIPQLPGSVSNAPSTIDASTNHNQSATSPLVSQTGSQTVSLAVSQTAAAANAPSTMDLAADARWLAQVNEVRSELTSPRFASGRQVSIDTDMLAERMQAHFENIHQQAVRILNEARDIQQQILAMDNVLRHEQQVIASRERIEQLRNGLIGLKGEVARSDRAMADEMSRIRAALLVEKESLLAASKAYHAPDANELAIQTLEVCCQQLLRESLRYGNILCDIIHKPFQSVRPERGRDLRHASTELPGTDIQSAKLSGELELDGKRLPFTASGSFKIPADDMVSSSDHATARSYPEASRWKMAIGEPGSQQMRSDDEAAILLQATTTAEMRGGELQPSSSVHIEDVVSGLTADGQFSAHQIAGQASTEFRDCLTAWSEELAVGRAGKLSSEVRDYVRAALSDLDEAPEQLRFQFELPRDLPRESNQRSSDQDEARYEFSEEAVRWLAQRLEDATSQQIAALYVGASQSLEAYVGERTQVLQRSVALMRNDADQHLNQQLDELKRVQAAINNNLQQRAGTHFARQPGQDVVR